MSDLVGNPVDRFSHDAVIMLTFNIQTSWNDEISVEHYIQAKCDHERRLSRLISAFVVRNVFVVCISLKASFTFTQTRHILSYYDILTIILSDYLGRVCIRLKNVNEVKL